MNNINLWRAKSGQLTLSTFFDVYYQHLFKTEPNVKFPEPISLNPHNYAPYIKLVLSPIFEINGPSNMAWNICAIEPPLISDLILYLASNI